MYLMKYSVNKFLLAFAATPSNFVLTTTPSRRRQTTFSRSLQTL